MYSRNTNKACGNNLKKILPHLFYLFVSLISWLNEAKYEIIADINYSISSSGCKINL